MKIPICIIIYLFIHLFIYLLLFYLFIIIIVYLSSIQLTNGPYHESYWPAFQSLDWGDSEGLHVSRGIT